MKEKEAVSAPDWIVRFTSFKNPCNTPVGIAGLDKHREETCKSFKELRRPFSEYLKSLCAFLDKADFPQAQRFETN